MTGLRAKNFSWVKTCAIQNGIRKACRNDDGIALLPPPPSHPSRVDERQSRPDAAAARAERHHPARKRTIPTLVVERGRIDAVRGQAALPAGTISRTRQKPQSDAVEAASDNLDPKIRMFISKRFV